MLQGGELAKFGKFPPPCILYGAAAVPKSQALFALFSLWAGLLHGDDVDAADAFDFLELGNDGV